MRTLYQPRTRRNVLCVFPRYANSFGTFQHAYPFFGRRVKAFMPPQGLLVIAAYLPESWPVRFVDENARAVTDDELEWADAVFVSGMHIQRPQIHDIIARAQRRGRRVVLGGPSVSGCPEYYPDADVRHLGELGDATDQLIEWLDTTAGRPEQPLTFATGERVPLSAFPSPAYHLASIRQYFLASVQFSSGCPYACEFCDIPALYGRNPRLKDVAQVLAELDTLVAAGASMVHFVDDNFIANQKATLEFLPQLVAWQQARRYPLRFACEATLNLARNERLLVLMREAGFITVFCGIETPEPHALRAISKDQNLRMPILDAVQRFNAHGIEVVSGIILGFDTDGPETADRILDFIEASKIPVLTINILYALPKTPLWSRLEREGRLRMDDGAESNIVFKLPRETVLEMWRRCITAAYDPAALYGRFEHYLAQVVPHRKAFPPSRQRASWGNLVMAGGVLRRIIWRIGVRGTYRRIVWRVAWPALRHGQIEALFNVAVVSHHLIEFTQDCLRGDGEASFYAPAGAGSSEATATVAVG